MKPALKITAHLAVGLAAFFLIVGTGIWDKRNPADGASLRLSEKERSGGSGQSGASRNTAVKTRMKAAEYRAAWDAIAGMRWSKSERLAYQTKLLAEWAETDLEGALAAALSESWKDGLMSNFGSPFHDVFVDRAEDIRRLIEQRKLGVLETSLLLRAWSSTLASRSPDLYLAYLRGLDGADFSTAVSAAVDSVKDKELGLKIMEVMAAKAQDEWAMNLPPREETTEMFHRGVEPYIRKDRAAAWNWIQQMDAGYWRDRALAEYSQVNLHVFNDPEKSSAAIDQITDPTFRDTAKGWRAGWEKQKGK